MTRKEADELIEAIYDKCHGLATNVDEPYDSHDIVFIDSVVEVINQLFLKKTSKEAESTDQELVPLIRAKWRYRKFARPTTDPYGYECTNCGNGMSLPWDYCPNCGALMDLHIIDPDNQRNA